jgi:hypothetical protein
LRVSRVGRIRRPHSAGLSVSALIELITAAVAIVRPNCLYMTPVMPPMKAVGTNTARSTRVVAMTGPVISSMAFSVASFAPIPDSSMLRATFSTTTIASSTTMPMASTRPNSVSVLSEKPMIAMTANVPISETGIVAVGISVVRRSCRKIRTVRMTSTAAMKSVSTMSLIEATTTLDASYGTSYSSPSGNVRDRSASVARTFSEMSSTFAPGSW